MQSAQMKPWHNQLTALRLLGIALLSAALSACAPTNIQPMSSTTSAATEADEHELKTRADKLDQSFSAKGLILKDADINAYITEVAAKLLPDNPALASQFHVQVLRDPTVNAFALPNGSIYLHVGLLARLENEAQLAHVLAHEIAHVTQRHGLRSHRSYTNKVVAAHVTDILLGGTSIAYIPFAAAIAGYSREMELEADHEALKTMSAAGYRLTATENLFELIQEAKQSESVMHSIYASHPGDQSRQLQTRRFIETSDLELNADGITGTEPYKAHLSEFLKRALPLKLRVKQYRLALDLADSAISRLPNNPYFHYFRGEALRLMADDPEGAAKEASWIEGQPFKKNHD
ncbi:MAG: M48 family metallopeptidase [Immundisolibacteraceae bacterium]|nr:M48 family metallopeptidase [Immundisolibacteraceae bacterium]